MKLSHFDRTLIHGLALMSRPPLIHDAGDFRMLADIIETAARGASREGEMQRLVRAAGHVGRTPVIHQGSFHHIASAMNEFDRAAMAAHWDQMRGVRHG